MAIICFFFQVLKNKLSIYSDLNNKKKNLKRILFVDLVYALHISSKFFYNLLLCAL